MDIASLTIKKARELLDKREISADELRAEFVDYASVRNSALNAFLEIYEKPRPAPIAADGPLSGIPGIIKDNILYKSKRCTAGSKILEDYIATYDATVIKKLERAGAEIIGKGNLDEFAMGSTGEYSAFGPTKNPHDESRVSGGSSSGPTAAVASGMALFGLGSETGGSIRMPASWCGVVGVKPTYGRVSRHGLIAMASSLDQIGSVTKNVEDAALIMNIISGHDVMDSTTSPREVPDYKSFLNRDIKGLKIAVVKEFFSSGLDQQVNAEVQKALLKFQSLGAVVDYVSLPLTDYALATYYVIVPSEISANLARFDGIRYGHSEHKHVESLLDVYTKSRSFGFGAEPRRRIMTGTYALSAGYYDAYYLKAQKVRTLIKRDFEKIFKDYDVIVGPTSATMAPKIGEFDNPLAFYLADVYMVQVNLAGLPAISIPCGFGELEGKKLPIGLHIIGKHFDEGTLFRVAHAFESR